MQDVLICQICKEPIHSFVCIDCLADDIRKWLPSDLAGSFAKFNRWFLSTFGHQNHRNMEHQHMVNGATGVGNVCIYCYVNEVFQWLKEQNKAIAKRFRRLFSFGMKDTDFREVVLAHAEPISEVESMKEEFGICDECGEYADELRLLNGRWICIECCIN